ncbi:MAG: glycosyltransferase family 1 protein [Aggregatilineales bacterium]
MPLHIAIDASRTTAARVTGTERYAIRMIQALLNHETTHRIALYFRQAPPPELFLARPNVTLHTLPFPRLWTHLRFAAALWRARPDVTWVPAHTLPAAFPGRAVVTVHDLGYRHFPKAHPSLARIYLDLTTRYSARRAAIVLADSAATAADLTRFYGTPPNKIRVIYPGIDPPIIGNTAVLRRKYRLPERYFLFIGTLQPRKNIAGLVEAFRRWRQRNRGDETALVLAGAKGWLYDATWTHEANGSPTPGVFLTGYVDDEDKGALYAGALAFVFPSLHEGFGFPVLEAMACGTPVLCSSTSSLPELAGEAALLVDPLDIDAIADGMDRLACDGDLRAKLRARGQARAAAFTWERAAQGALAALEAAADG